jgi:cell wall-associated NlpC family hydrolase
VAKHTAAQIYAYARAAGFDPDQAVTMTAIALAESGGRSGALNTDNEDSRGLWQINVEANGELVDDLDLFSPRDNAIAAFRVSQQGRDISPWTTTHGGSRARYMQFRDQAQAAAVAHGDPAGLGMWQGTRGYGDHQPAGRYSSSEPVADPTIAAAGSPGGGPLTTDPAGRSGASIHGLALAQPDSVPASVPGSASAPDPAGEPESDLAGPGTGDPAGIVPAAFTTGTDTGAGDGAGAGTGIGAPTADRHGLVLAAPDQPAAGSAGSALGVAPMRIDPSLSPDPSGPVPGGATDVGAPTSRADQFIAAALDQRGDPYVFGAQARLSDPNPQAFDCSELVRWAAHQTGTEVPDGSWLQFLHLRRKGLVIPVEEGIQTKGALLFSFSSPPTASGGRPSHSHVAISLGDERTIEARGRAYGVDSFSASSKRFQYAAVLPGMTESAPARAGPEIPEIPEGPPAPTGGELLDTDGDGLVNRLERRLGLDPMRDDTDGDRLSDSYELLFGGTDPLTADVGGGAWSSQIDDALLTGTSAVPAADPGETGNGRHGLALAQPDDRPGRPSLPEPDDGSGADPGLADGPLSGDAAGPGAESWGGDADYGDQQI